eukprot:TCONS_00008761-protein
MRSAIFLLSIFFSVDCYIFDAQRRTTSKDSFKKVWQQDNEDVDPINDVYPYWYDKHDKLPTHVEHQDDKEFVNDAIEEEIFQRLRGSTSGTSGFTVGSLNAGCKNYDWCEGYKAYCQSHDVMKNYCQKTCGLCAPPPQPKAENCDDELDSCPNLKHFCGQGAYMNYMKDNCKATCNLCDGAKALSCGIAKMRQKKATQSFIVGGANAKNGFYPWQAAIYYDGDFLCGGSLISKKLVMTAAHCFKMLSTDVDVYQIVLGDHNRDINDGNEETFAIRRITQHPQYNYKSDNNDIAIMELATPASYGAYVNRICLPQQNEVLPVGTVCYISGWGKLYVGGSATNLLQELKVPIVKRKVCQQRNHFNGHIVNDNMICAGYNDGMNFGSGCHGDSGGPLACAQTDGSWRLYGVVSWGSPQCNGLDRYTVFARVSKYMDWIDSFK